MLYGEWKGQMGSCIAWCEQLEEELLDASLMVMPATGNPEEALTPAIRSMSEIFLCIQDMRQQMEKDRHQMEVQVGEVPRQVGDLINELECISETVDLSLRAAREDLRENPLLGISQERQISQCLELQAGLKVAQQALKDLDEDSFNAQIRILSNSARAVEGDMPWVSSAVYELANSVSSNQVLLALKDLPLQIMRSRMSVSRYADRIHQVWEMTGQDAGELYQASRL